MLKVAKDWKTKEDGGTLAFVGVCLTLLLGFAALTFDLGRMAATQSDMQGFADHVALAAAGELDGKSDSITRARTAAAELIQDRQTFATGAQNLGGNADFSLRFLSGLPATDRTYFDPNDDLSAFETDDPFQATLVEVTTTARTVFLPFYRAFGALRGSEAPDGIVGARAVAGFTQYACDIATMMFCLPDSTSNPDALSAGSSIRLRTGGQGAAWGPGNFGFLDPSEAAVDPNGDCASLSGSARYQCLIASSGNRTRCFAQRGVDMNTGQAVGIENAVFNTRFDIYQSTMSQNKGSKIFAPSMHRVTGYKAKNGNGQCLPNNVEESENSMAFPPAACHGSGCGAFAGPGWALSTYIETNYGEGVTLQSLRETNEFFAELPENPTRFDVYLAEHETAVAVYEEDGTTGNGLPSGDLNGDYTSGTCSTVTPSTNPNRRVFIAAGIDCDLHNINGAKKGVPVESFYEVFLMRPVGLESGGPGNFDLHVEMIGPAGGDGAGDADDGGIFRDVVELYR